MRKIKIKFEGKWEEEEKKEIIKKIKPCDDPIGAVDSGDCEFCPVGKTCTCWDVIDEGKTDNWGNIVHPFMFDED